MKKAGQRSRGNLSKDDPWRETWERLLINILERWDDHMRNEIDLKASIDKLASSVAALEASITKIPAAPDLTADVSAVDTLTGRVDAVTKQVNDAIPAQPAPTEPTAGS